MGTLNLYFRMPKSLQKADMKVEEIKNWRPIIYKLIKLISGCQKAYQNTANIGEIILGIIETIALCNYHKKFGTK